ncbi:DUF262 domain-containing protein [Cellulomonas marina]|uniref:GmrSD restriction endonucleases N-terminal domain-containing protein n=1 Tax=Cellulomonas marina TaxID=988821 RepID=A0A1I0YD48_9CELL|nr:DUF262 domain-containing protein [Cellulomonas marina]GIG29672.1 hypothetical protein Cma02nite_22720 [Cellulomonas marina]SFB11082.1 Protein of unknown function DUF262 [Cellulomonas marina]
MSTKPELWSIGDLRAARRAPAPTDRYVLRIPQFQRGVVWGEPKQRELIASIGLGYPIGALLLALTGYEDVLDGSNTKHLPVYSLIDGLQRTTALLNYIEEPLLRDPGDFLEGPALDNLTEEFRRALPDCDFLSAESVKTSIMEWMRATKTVEVTSGFTPSKLLARVAHDHDFEYTMPIMERLEAPLGVFLASVSTHCDISGVQIPVLLYSGPSETLPEVFKRLNSQGAPLTKYQIFAASWSSDKTRLASPDIRQAIKDRYDTIVESGYELADIDADDLGDSVSLFDYLTGLGQVLSRATPLLFAESEPDTIQSLAFSLVTLVAGRRLEDMAALPSFLKKPGSDEIELTAFEEAARWACGFVEGQLRGVLGFKLNAAQAGSGAHSELQVVSMVAAAVVSRFDPETWSERPNWSAREPLLKRAVTQYYVLDILRREWRGGLYSLAFSRVWKEPTEKGSRAVEVAPYYLTPLSREQFEEQLKYWFAEEVVKEQRERSRMSSADRLLLKVAYAHTMTYADHESDTLYEIDHIFPVKRLKALIQQEPEGGWPIGAIGNLALIPKSLNRRKRDETVPEFLARAGAAGAPALAASAGAIENMLFMPASEFEIPKDQDGADCMTKEQYVEKVRARWTILQDFLLDKLCE